MAQGDGPSDLAGLFALLLAGTLPAQPEVTQRDGAGAQAAPTSAPLIAGDVARALPPPAAQPTSALGAVAASAEALQPAWPLPAAPAKAASAPAGTPPQFTPASPDATVPGPDALPSADRAAPALLPSFAAPGPDVTLRPGTAAPPPTAPLAPLDAVRPETVPPARPETVALAMPLDATGAPSGQAPHTGAAGDPAEPRARLLAATGDRARASELRRALASSPSATSDAPAAAADRSPAGDRAWLEPGSDAAHGATARPEQATSDLARAPASGRTAPPAPVFQIGVQIAKAAPARIDRLFVQLEPATLGRVEVRLKFHRNDQVSAVIAAERPDTLEALQRDARLLERSLHQAGLRMDGNGLTFSLKREQADHQPREEGPFAPAAGDVGERALPAALDPAPPLHWFRGLRALDIRV
jgi:hypothetical protein